MNLKLLRPTQSLNKAYRKEKVNRAEIEKFKVILNSFLTAIDEKEGEEHAKNKVTKFLYDAYYNGKNEINTKGRIDLAIYEGQKPVVVIEAKRPKKDSDMAQKDNLNVKAMHELILYYLRERIDESNIDIKFLIITNIYEWFVFDAIQFDKLFYKNKNLVKDYQDWKLGRKSSIDTSFFYTEIVKPFLNHLNEEILFTWFNFKDYEKIISDNDPKNDSKLIPLYKFLSPINLLKQSFSNDSNSLDTRFYSELLHIIGLEEQKQGGKKIIGRRPQGKRDPASLIENTINILEAEDRIRRLPDNSIYGQTNNEKIFNVALELCITWINRILFLKLLEAQLHNYHSGDVNYRFLDYKTIPNYDELNKLFFQVLALPPNLRPQHLQEKYARVPYLNSSLFEIKDHDLEDNTIRINSLDDSQTIKLFQNTVLKDEKGKKKVGKFPLIQYLFEFLDSYDFSSEGSEDIQEDNKKLINASVLGLIFEKINGYKDGSFYTPGFITMYICKETIRRAIIQKFNEVKGWEVKDFIELYNKIKNIEEANEIINSISVCDPAVGSGHFLVSALNEILSAKSELGIFTDRNNKILRDYNIEVINDELIVSINHEVLYEYKPGNKESQRVQEALFHEKQNIIESCLFGVDINPNSVKICRLRLWIELLKHSYYKEESGYKELETLPNIDINIKQGNSLVSRYDLKSDLSKALKSIKYNIQQYKEFVNNYKNATNKEEKRGFEYLINQIKTDFRTEISKTDPPFIKLNKLSGELYNLLNQGKIFEFSSKELKVFESKKEKLEKDINKLSAEIEEIKGNAIFKNAFEWRFEFPEVLDNEGNFKGFDVIIGNPPYVFGGNEGIATQEKKHYSNVYKTGKGKINLFTLFIEKSFELMSSNAYFSFIIPNTYLRVTSYHESRKLLIDNYNIESIYDFGDTVFDDAITTAIVLVAQKKLPEVNNIITIINKDKENSIVQENLKGSNYVIAINIDNEKRKIIDNLIINTIPLGEICKELIFGVVITKNKDEVVTTIPNSEWKPFLEGKDIGPYYIRPIHSYLNYDSKLLHRPRTKDIFETPEKLLVQRITGGSKPLKVAYDNRQYYNKESINNIILKEDAPYSYKFILGLLNSKLINWYYTNQFTNESYLTVNISKEYLSQIPVAITSTEEQIPFIVIVDYLLFINNGNNPPVNNFTDNASIAPVFEDVVNMMVYEMYFKQHMQDLEIDVLQFIDTNKHFKPIDTSEKANKEANAKIIGDCYKWLQEQDNAIRNRIILSNVKSTNIIRRINASTN